MADSTLTGSANLLICPNMDAANILYNVLKTTTSGGVTVGPILMGAAATAYILTPAATVRRVLNMTALAVASSACGTFSAPQRAQGLLAVLPSRSSRNWWSAGDGPTQMRSTILKNSSSPTGAPCTWPRM
jgi:hypothetical protein